MKTKRFLSIGAAFMVKAAVRAAVSAAMPMVLLTFALVLAACGTLGSIFSISSAVNTADSAGETGSAESSASTKRRAENSLNTFSRGTDQYQVRFANDEFVIVRYQGSSGKVDIPAGFEGVPVVAIEGDAFDRHPEITSITIPASVIRIGADLNSAEDAFDGCAGLTDITVAEENEIYSSEDGVLFDKDKTTLLLCPEGKSGSYTIPASVTAIVLAAFEGCGRLTGVTIPNSVTSIGELAFAKSTGLTSVIIPNSVTSIEAQAFVNCEGLTSIIIPNSVTYIGGNAFAGCTRLTSVTVSPVAGRVWDDIISGRSGASAFVDSSSVNDASKTALRNAGYTGGF
jgi:hypothetical protein